jgi:hypothetical protein
MTSKREKIKQWIDIIQGVVLIISLPIALISLLYTASQPESKLRPYKILAR